MPSSTDPCFGYCSPPLLMVGVVTAHLREYRARVVIIIPAVCLSWFPLVASASVRSLPVASLLESNVFLRVHHLKGEKLCNPQTLDHLLVFSRLRWIVTFFVIPPAEVSDIDWGPIGTPPSGARTLSRSQSNPSPRCGGQRPRFMRPLPRRK